MRPPRCLGQTARFAALSATDMIVPSIATASPSSPADKPPPDLRVPRLREQAPGQQQVHHHAGRQAPDTALDPAGLLQHRIDHLERHLLRQLAQVPRSETASGHRHDTRNDRLIQRRGSRGEVCLGRQTSLTGAPPPSAAISALTGTP